MVLTKRESKELSEIKKVLKGTKVKYTVNDIGKIKFTVGKNTYPINTLGNNIGISALSQAKAIKKIHLIK